MVIQNSEFKPTKDKHNIWVFGKNFREIQKKGFILFDILTFISFFQKLSGMSSIIPFGAMINVVASDTNTKVDYTTGYIYMQNKQSLNRIDKANLWGEHQMILLNSKENKKRKEENSKLYKGKESEQFFSLLKDLEQIPFDITDITSLPQHFGCFVIENQPNESSCGVFIWDCTDIGQIYLKNERKENFKYFCCYSFFYVEQNKLDLHFSTNKSKEMLVRLIESLFSQELPVSHFIFDVDSRDQNILDTIFHRFNCVGVASEVKDSFIFSEGKEPDRNTLDCFVDPRDLSTLIYFGKVNPHSNL